MKYLPQHYSLRKAAFLFLFPVILISCTTFVQHAPKEKAGQRERRERDVQ